MTKDEAREKLLEATDNGCTPDFMRDFIDSAVALGLLKLDEPKSLLKFFRDECLSAGLSPRNCNLVINVMDQMCLVLVKMSELNR